MIINCLFRQPECHAVAAAVNDYISMFTGMYGSPTEKSGKSVPRVVEEITSVLGTKSIFTDKISLCYVPYLLVSRAVALDIAIGSF